MKFLIAFASLVALTVAIPYNLPQTKGAIEDGIIDFLEKIRKQMPCGFEELGIPPLAPFEYDYFEYDYESESIAVGGSVSNVIVVGLDTFIIEKVAFNLLSLTLSFDVTLADITASGTYDLHGRALAYPFSGNGKFSASALGLRFSGSTKLALKNGFLDMSNFKSKFELASMKMNFEGLVGGENTSEFLNSVLAKLIPDLVKENEQLISDTIEDLVKTNANSVLNTLTLKDLIDLITSGGGGGMDWECDK